VVWVFGPELLWSSGVKVSYFVPWYPSKSGVIHRHIVKHIVKHIVCEPHALVPGLRVSEIWVYCLESRAWFWGIPT
jgi:hypothetical protein